MRPLYPGLNQQQRRLFIIANVSLILGLAPWIFRQFIPVNHDWLDAFSGFFIGLNVTINLFCLRAARRCGQPEI